MEASITERAPEQAATGQCNPRVETSCASHVTTPSIMSVNPVRAPIAVTVAQQLPPQVAATVQFSTRQLGLIKQGTAQRSLLAEAVKQAFGLIPMNVEGKKRHTYIVSPPGIGKTFTVRATAAENGIKPVTFGGSQSMIEFVITTAVTVYTQCRLPSDRVPMWVDDCDSFFVDREGLNIMKGVLDPDFNKLTYSRHLINMIARFENSEHDVDRIKAEALRAFQQPHSTGVVIPTDQLTFIITSNRPLASGQEVLASNRPNERKMHEAAIRDRLNYRSLKLSREETWGWLASILLERSPRGRDGQQILLTEQQKVELLCWMGDHWNQLPSASMRTVEDLALLMVNYPRDYRARWNVHG